MTDAIDDAVFEPIPREECLELLATQVVGRVAVSEPGAAPLVVPVNYTLSGDTPVFRSDYGTKFRLMVLGEQPVSFQVDQVDDLARGGWSVLVQGHAEEVDPEDPALSAVVPWAGGRKDRWVRIVPRSITGRRLGGAGAFGAAADASAEERGRARSPLGDQRP